MEKDQVRAALSAAGDAVGHYGTAEKAVLAFLAHMDEHYVGDMYLEGAVHDLRFTVAEVSS